MAETVFHINSEVVTIICMSIIVLQDFFDFSQLSSISALAIASNNVVFDHKIIFSFLTFKKVFISHDQQISESKKLEKK